MILPTVTCCAHLSCASLMKYSSTCFIVMVCCLPAFQRAACMKIQVMGFAKCQ